MTATPKTLILLTPLCGAELERLKAPFFGCRDIVVVRTGDELSQAVPATDGVLLSFGSGLIVPADILSQFAGRSYNIHAASPDFPGRDPHHHAVYRRARTYGATLHVMTEEVDAGPIIAVERFSVPVDAAPADLLAMANEAGLRLAEAYGPRLVASAPPAATSDETWGSVKTKRADLKRLCSISPLIDKDEFEHRFRAFDGGAYDNLTVELHERTFRIDKQTPPREPWNEGAEFTEAAFRSMLVALKEGGYSFSRYGEALTERHVIWRHDVDFSMHRALRTAQIESDETAVATYFINPRSTFYNVFEPEVERLVRRIRSLGHEIGLHFDALAYDQTRWTLDTLAPALTKERRLLETAVGAPVRTVSWHNPDQSNLLEFDADDVCGLVNVYSETLRRNYTYCSDSNGYWRFNPMPEVIAEGHQRLHLLTHPAWWTLSPMSPSERIDLAILGRARKVRRDYDKQLRIGGRANVE